MNSRQLETLVALAETGSFRKAGERLMLTPSGTKYILDGLETETGLALFDRTHAGLIPTEPGAILIDHARKAMDFWTQGIELARSKAQTQDFEIFAPYIGKPRIRCSLYGPAFLAFKTAHPNIRLRFKQVKDMAGLTFDAVNGNVGPVHIPVATHRLSELPLHCIVAADHPLFHRTSVCIEDLAPFETLVPEAHLVDLMDKRTRDVIQSNRESFKSMDPERLEEDPEHITWISYHNRVAIVLDHQDSNREASSMIRSIPIEGACFAYNLYTPLNPSPATVLYTDFIVEYYTKRGLGRRLERL